jgi:hypothetical protein
MSSDLSKIEQLVAEQAAAVKEEHGEDWEYGDVLLIAEVVTPEGSEIRVRFSEGSANAAYGLLKLAESTFTRERPGGSQAEADPSPGSA